MARAIIHAGFHKTGTTAAQKFFQAHAERLAANGIAVYRGRHHAFNHAELHACAMRDDRSSPFKAGGGIVDSVYRAEVASEIAAFNTAHAPETLLFSAEGISLLRYPDELQRLADLIADRELSFIFARREREAWRDSYRAQHAHLITSAPVTPDHFLYLENNSWLLDFDARLQAFRDAFGADAVHVIDYDAAMAKDSSIIPSLLTAIGVAPAFSGVDLSIFHIDPRRRDD